MGAFEDVHQSRITGSLAMFDRMIFKGHLLRLYHPGGVQACHLPATWDQVEATFASGMGPPPLPVMGPP
jgi:hypothetical protein